MSSSGPAKRRGADGEEHVEDIERGQAGDPAQQHAQDAREQYAGHERRSCPPPIRDPPQSGDDRPPIRNPSENAPESSPRLSPRSVLSALEIDRAGVEEAAAEEIDDERAGDDPPAEKDVPRDGVGIIRPPQRSTTVWSSATSGGTIRRERGAAVKDTAGRRGPPAPRGALPNDGISDTRDA